MKYLCAQCGAPATHTRSNNDRGTLKTEGQMTLGTWSCKPCGGKTKVKREKA